MTPLPGSERELLDHHDVFLLDLDGTIYIGEDVIAGAPGAVAALRSRGRRPLFVTNNASRTAEAIAAGLRSMGIPAAAPEVVTSAQAAAALLAGELAPNAAVLVVGGEGVVTALLEVGLRPVSQADGAEAVVQGFAPSVGWRDLAEATFAIGAGADWVATNRDLTLPTERGLAPGNGALVEAVRVATGIEPRVAGKPEQALLRLAVARAGARAPLVVGDRLDTDIEWAVRGGAASLLVLTGVTDVAALLAAVPGSRPTHIGRGLEALKEAHPAVVPAPAEPATRAWQCAGWTAVAEGTDLRLDGSGRPLDSLRAACAAVWSAADAGHPVEVSTAFAVLAAVGVTARG